MKRIIGNWKANKNRAEAEEWCTTFSQIVNEDSELRELLTSQAVQAIVCPPFPFLEVLNTRLKDLPNVAVGAQNVAAYRSGAYTGEIPALNLQGLVKYSIIGHSERRSYFHETDQDVLQKVSLCKEFGIEPIVCVRSEKDIIPEGVGLVAFEPVSAIGTGQNMPAAEVVTLKQKFTIPSDAQFFYGGSVNETTALDYTKESAIDGLLVGGASLNPAAFAQILRIAGSTVR